MTLAAAQLLVSLSGLHAAAGAVFAVAFLWRWVGRLDPKKNVEDFIEAAALVAEQNERARFLVIGGNYPCAPINMNRGLGDLTWVQGVPGTVFTGLQCYGPMDLAEMQASAMKGNDARVNRTIQDNLIGGFIPISEFEVRTATEAGGLADADTVARCEYTGQAVIHIHPALAEQWMGKEIIRVGRHLETVMGAMVSLNCWLPVDQIAVTGWLTVLKGASRVLDPYHDVSGGSGRGAPLNLWYVNVQTPATVFNDCNLAVLIGGVEGGGPPPVVGPVTLTSVTPTDISLDGFVTLQINGTGFSKTYRPR